jgi:hypothetical protein
VVALDPAYQSFRRLEPRHSTALSNVEHVSDLRVSVAVVGFRNEDPPQLAPVAFRWSERARLFAHCQFTSADVAFVADINSDYGRLGDGGSRPPAVGRFYRKRSALGRELAPNLYAARPGTGTMTEAEDDEQPAAQELPEELKRQLERFLPEPDEGDTTGVDRAPYEAVAGRVQELLAERTGGHRQIDTRSGEKITPFEPDCEKVNLEDIAHGLSNVGRFAGQGKDFYSVARHSVHVSLEVEARGGTQEAQRYALLHDAAEAYLSDVPGPVKKSLPGYKHAERRLDETIVAALGLDDTDEGRELTEEADEAVGKHELSVQFPDGGHDEPDLSHDPKGVGEDEDDKKLFLERSEGLQLG